MTAAVTTLPEGEPDATLGWDVLAWAAEYVRQPDGPDAGEPFRFTREQVRHVLWLYALDPAGRFVYTRAVLRRAKGWGKSPFLGALALAELCGPVRFGGWSASGAPVAVPATAAWVQIAGVSLDQTDNTMTMVLGMVRESPVVADYGLDVGITRVYSAAGGRLEPITASASTAEGARPSFVVLDETHHWTAGNGGHKLAEVIRRNLGKSRDGAARSVETTNAHEPGQGSVAERSHEAWQLQRDGVARGSSLLYDSREAPAGTDLADEGSLLTGLRAAYGDSTWVDLRRVVDEVWDPNTPTATARRFYLNQVVAAVDAWLAPHEWDACARPDLYLQDRDQVVLGFDGSRTDDATALVACRVSDGLLDLVGVWEHPTGEAAATWEVPRDEVDHTVRAAFRRFRVVGFYADPELWESYVDRWRDELGDSLLVEATTGTGKRAHPIAWGFYGREAEVVRAVERTHSDVVSGELVHTGHRTLRRHVLNARRRPGRYGVGIGKESKGSPRKIDAAVAAVLARLARRDLIATGALTNRTGKKRPGRVLSY